MIENIRELKNNNDLERAFNSGIRALNSMGIDISKSNCISNALYIDRMNMTLFPFAQNSEKRDISEEEDLIIKIIIEIIPLAVIYDEIVLTKLFIELLKIAKKLGKSKITPLAFISAAYIKMYYYDDLSIAADFLRKAQKNINKEDREISILVMYAMCAYFNHMIDDTISSEHILRDNLQKCEDPVLCDLIKVYMAQNIILEGGKLRDIDDVHIKIESVKQRNLLLLYTVYAKAMMGELSILNDEFLLSLAIPEKENVFVALILTYMYYVHLNDIAYCKKYSKKIVKEINNVKVYPISYQYYIYNIYYQFRNLKTDINFKIFIEISNILRNIEFFSILKENELKNIYTFLSGLKDIYMRRKLIGEKKLRNSIKEIRKFSNMKDYAIFSHIYLMYKENSHDYKPVRYYLAELESAYTYCEAKCAWKSILLESEEEVDTSLVKNDTDKDMIADFMDKIEEDFRFDKNVIGIVENNYNFDRVIVFSVKEEEIFDSYGININDIEGVARNLVDYSFKKRKKFFIGGKRGQKLRSIDSYLLKNLDSSIMLLPFENFDKILYLESKSAIRNSIELDLNDFVKNINKVSGFYR